MVKIRVKGNNMGVYRSNYKYTVTILIGLFFSLFCMGAAGFTLILGKAFPYLWMLVALMILYFLLFLIPKEISFDGNSIIYKTIAQTQKVDTSQIKSIKPYFSTKSMQWYGGNKDKAHMLCIITLKGKPLTFLFFGNGLNNYKDLFSKVTASLEEDSTN